MKDVAAGKSSGVLVFGLRGLAEGLGLIAQKSSRQPVPANHASVDIPGHGCLPIASLCFMGDTCLRTNLITKRILADMTDGEVIEIVTDNLSSVETIPFMSPNYNGVHLATVHTESCWKIYIRKGDDAPANTAIRTDRDQEE